MKNEIKRQKKLAKARKRFADYKKRKNLFKYKTKEEGVMYKIELPKSQKNRLSKTMRKKVAALREQLIINQLSDTSALKR